MGAAPSMRRLTAKGENGKPMITVIQSRPPSGRPGVFSRRDPAYTRTSGSRAPARRRVSTAWVVYVRLNVLRNDLEGRSCSTTGTSGLAVSGRAAETE